VTTYYLDVSIFVSGYSPYTACGYIYRKYKAGVTTTTYYRVLSSVQEGCNTGGCLELSYCVTITANQNVVLLKIASK